MQRQSFEQKFVSYLFKLILKQGGTRMQMVMGDITKELQKLPPTDEINLHRKQYGNLEQCLKQLKNTFFIIDSMVIKFKPNEEIIQLYNDNFISNSDFQYYKQVYEENQAKLIQVMKINKENQCINCGQTYKININNVGFCETTGDKHYPKHNY